jgi:hypothetical protein
LFKPADFGAAIFRDLGLGVGTADGGTKSNDVHVIKLVTCVVTSGVLDAVEMFVERGVGCLGHGVIF